MLTTDRLDLFDRPDGKSYLTKSELKELTTAYRELKKIKEQAPVAEFVTLFSTPKGTVEFLGRVPDRKLCDLKEGDLLYKQEVSFTAQLPWLKVIDETLVVHHIGAADASDTYEQAKQKINLLLCTQQSLAVAVPDEETNFCALKSITDAQVNAVARAFWRRIYAYRNHYGVELPKPLPVEFMAHMATALTWVDREPSPRITEQDALAAVEKLDHVLKMNKEVMTNTGVVYIQQCRALLNKLNRVTNETN